jgi:hypothetical protein
VKSVSKIEAEAVLPSAVDSLNRGGGDKLLQETAEDKPLEKVNEDLPEKELSKESPMNLPQKNLQKKIMLNY